MDDIEKFKNLKQEYHKDFIFCVQGLLEQYHAFNGTIIVKYNSPYGYEKKISKEEFLTSIVEQMIDELKFMKLKIDLADLECNFKSFAEEDEDGQDGVEELIKNYNQEIKAWREKQDKKMKWVCQNTYLNSCVHF